MAAHKPLTPNEHAAIRDAIRAAERETSGEIVCVVARRSDGYFFPAATALLLFLLVGSLCVSLALEHFWLSLRLPAFVGAQMLSAGCGLFVLKLRPGLRLALTPHGLRARAVRANAVKQFLARNIHRTAARTGILIFVSLAERRAELLADSGINERVPPGTWDALLSELTVKAGRGQLAGGIIGAVAEAGRLLALHFPPEPDNRNELSDHLVEI